MNSVTRGVAAVVGLGVLTAAVALAAFSSGSSASGREKVKDDKIKEIAAAWAHDLGEAAPRALEYAESNRATAVMAMSRGDVVADVNDVFLVEMEGHFVAQGAPRPPGMRAPSGSVLTLVIDAFTGQTLDIGISDRKTDMRALGPMSGPESEPPSGDVPPLDTSTVPEPGAGESLDLPLP